MNIKSSTKEIETKIIQGSFKFGKSNEKDLVKYNVCIPQNPFFQVSIDYNSENEKNFHNLELNEDRFEGQINYNYSFKPRKDKKSDKINESYNEINKENFRIYEAVGFALSDEKIKNQKIIKIKFMKVIMMRILEFMKLLGLL